jgi:hypothetical protein
MTASSPTLGFTQPPIQWVSGFLSPGVKWLGREAIHSPPSIPEVKEAWNYIFIPSYVFTLWYSVKNRMSSWRGTRDNFTSTFSIIKVTALCEDSSPKFCMQFSYSYSSYMSVLISLLYFCVLWILGEMKISLRITVTIPCLLHASAVRKITWALCFHTLLICVLTSK